MLNSSILTKCQVLNLNNVQIFSRQPKESLSVFTNFTPILSYKERNDRSLARIVSGALSECHLSRTYFPIHSFFPSVSLNSFKCNLQTRPRPLDTLSLCMHRQENYGLVVRFLYLLAPCRLYT